MQRFERISFIDSLLFTSNKNDSKRILCERLAEDIIDEKVENGEEYYLMKWKYWGEENNAWEPRKHLSRS